MSEVADEAMNPVGEVVEVDANLDADAQGDGVDSKGEQDDAQAGPRQRHRIKSWE